MKEKIKVLIVDDNDINSFLLTHIVSAKFEADIHVALHGEDAVNHVKKNTYDIIFMDIEMPVMNGITAVKIIQDELNVKTPVVYVSAYLPENIQLNYPDFDTNVPMCNKPVKAQCIHDFIIKATT